MLLMCTKCNQEISSNSYICANCNYINPYSGKVDYFDYYNIDHKISISNKDIDSTHSYLMSLYHPDNTLNYSEESQYNAINHLNIIQDGYETLMNPLKCIEHLYTIIHNQQIIEEDAIETENFDINIAELSMSVYECENKTDIMKILNDVQGTINNSLNSIEENIFTDKSIAQSNYIKIKYLSRIKENCQKRIKEEFKASI